MVLFRFFLFLLFNFEGLVECATLQDQYHQFIPRIFCPKLKSKTQLSLIHIIH